MDEDIRPIGRELRLVNAAISLVTFLDPEWVPTGIVLTDPVRMMLDELTESTALYKAHMLKPKMKRHTLIPVPIVRIMIGE